MKTAAFVAAGLGLTVNAHLFISSPSPIEGSAPKSPLDASGSNFPCHGVDLPSSGGEHMSAGSSQLLSFDTGNGANTAVHGGGSCQISITYETEPAKVKDPKNWHVIYSIEGGCPSNTYQNLDGTYTGSQGSYTGAYDCSDPRTNGVDCVNQFNFTIPKGVKDGHAILAWTWFNTVGNREMYMNCVNTQLSGGDGSEMGSFPSMFVANMADVDSCPTTQSVNVLFPNAGKYVTTKNPSGAAAKTASTFPMATPTGSGCASDGGSGAYGGVSSSAAAAPSSSVYNSPSPAHSATASQATNAGADNAPITVTTFATVTSGSFTKPTDGASKGAAAPFNANSSTGVATGAMPDLTAAPNTGSTAGSTTSSTGSCPDGSVACSNEGDIVCMGGNKWGMCDVSRCAVKQDLASGTTCSGGQITRKRSIRHARKHVKMASHKFLY